ncbi:hypothetical protein F2Q69_00034759 [Brassica cretica]|uniref:Uncharacterized protein n=1 Tax=Brassica cretica TaxID=69181 RepID=A0A8S9SS92_BRACR|nr:hypothetical protein F2Q69_00034759 [Brassica cretica]
MYISDIKLVVFSSHQVQLQLQTLVDEKHFDDQRDALWEFKSEFHPSVAASEKTLRWRKCWGKTHGAAECHGPLSDSDLTLSPLVLPSRFVEERFRASFDPYGSNVDLIGPGTVSQLITSLEITEEPSEEPLVDVTSVPAGRVGVPEGGGPGERPENENLEEVPGRDNLEIGNTPVREEEAGNVGIEDLVLVSDSSSEGREGEEEEDDRVEEMSSLLLPKTQSVLLLLGRQRRDGFSAHHLARNYRGAIGGATGRCHVGSGRARRGPGGKDNPEIGNTPVREEESGNVGIEDPVLVSGEEEEDYIVEETSSLQPVEEKKPDEVGNRDVPPPPAVDSLVSISARVEDLTVATTEDPVGPSALGTPEEVGQDSAP